MGAYGKIFEKASQPRLGDVVILRHECSWAAVTEQTVDLFIVMQCCEAVSSASPLVKALTILGYPLAL